MAGPTLYSIASAAAAGIERVRLPNWANPLDHIKIDIIHGKPGLWLHLFSPINGPVNGKDPVTFLGIAGPMRTDYEVVELEAYDGPLPDSEEYRAAAALANRRFADG